jgi:septal ring factor EnvC (AmiA/AmiB activator)
MGAIKDLVDLVTQLNSSVEDRKFAGELRQVQSMIGAIQSEHAEIHEQRIDLLTKNAELRQEISTLKEEIQLLKQQLLESNTPNAGIQNTLADDEVRILLFLANAQAAPAQTIAHQIGHSLTKTQFWLTRLQGLDMIGHTISFYEASKYYLEQPGREYLVKNELI